MQTFQNRANDNSNDDTNEVEFEGYGDQGAFTMLPRLFMHFQFQDLSESTLKVMLYIFAHTWGYSDPCKKGQRKNADAISRSQFLEGVRRADGTIVDRGAGVSDRSLNRALTHLIELGYIFVHRRHAANGRCDTNVYELNIDGKPHWAEPTTGGDGGANKPRGGSKGNDKKRAEHKGYNTPANLPVFASSTPAIEIDSNVKTTPDQGANLAENIGANLPDTTYKLQHTTKHDTNNTILSTIQPSVKRETVESGQEKQQVESVCVDLSSNSPVKDLPAVGSGQISSSSATPNSRTGARHGNSYSSPSLSAASSPPQPPASTISLPSSSTSINPAFGVLNQALLAVSISKGEAHKLAALAVHNGHGADYVEQALAYVDAQRDVKSRPGLLIHLVKTNWQPSSVPASAGVAVSGSGETAHQSNPAAQIVGVLPTLATVNPLHVPKLIQIEARNLREATNDRQRVTAQARLERLQEIARQLAARNGGQQDLEMVAMLGTLNRQMNGNPNTASKGV